MRIIYVLLLLHLQPVKKLFPLYPLSLSLSDNKSSGSNSIPKRILKLLKKYISTHLVDIFNLSFSSGIYPTIFKTAKVIPIHKKCSKRKCSNYRPIALLSNTDKILETLLHKKLSNFLDKNKLIYYNLDLDRIIQLLMH